MSFFYVDSTLESSFYLYSSLTFSFSTKSFMFCSWVSRFAFFDFNSFSLWIAALSWCCVVRSSNERLISSSNSFGVFSFFIDLNVSLFVYVWSSPSDSWPFCLIYGCEIYKNLLFRFIWNLYPFKELLWLKPKIGLELGYDWSSRYEFATDLRFLNKLS